MKITRNRNWIILLAFLCLEGQAWAGNPFMTDDPEPVNLGHGEVFVAGSYFQNSGGTNGTGQFEVNYGAFPETQLHLIITGAFNAPNGQPASSGVGDTVLGVKYRFLRESPGVPQMGVYPWVVLPTGNASQGLGTGQTHVFLPLWIQKSWGPWTTYGGGGYWINPGTGNQNWVYLGWEAQRDLSPVVTLGGNFSTKPRPPWKAWKPSRAISA